MTQQKYDDVFPVHLTLREWLRVMIAMHDSIDVLDKRGHVQTAKDTREILSKLRDMTEYELNEAHKQVTEQLEKSKIISQTPLDADHPF